MKSSFHYTQAVITNQVSSLINWNKEWDKLLIDNNQQLPVRFLPLITLSFLLIRASLLPVTDQRLLLIKIKRREGTGMLINSPRKHSGRLR